MTPNVSDSRNAETEGSRALFKGFLNAITVANIVIDIHRYCGVSYMIPAATPSAVE